MAARLGALEGDDAHLEALRLWLVAEDGDQAAALLNRHGHDLCERGLAPDLWLLLDRAPAAVRAARPLVDWRAWCAFEWGDPRAQEVTPEPSLETWLSAHLLARKALRTGRLEAALESAAQAVALAPSPRDRDLARIHGARAAFSGGRLDAALALCAACEAPRGAVAVEIQLIRAECAALRGDPDGAARGVEALLAAVESLHPALRLRAYLGSARVHLMRQRLRDAERVVEAILAVRAERAADAVSGRTAIELAAAVAAQRGRFNWLRSLAERLKPGHRVAPVRFLFVRSFLAAADEWQATPAAFEAAAQSLRVDCDADGGTMAGDVRAYVDLLLTRIALQRGAGPETLGPPLPAVVVTHMLATGRDIVRAIHQARWGAGPGLPDPEGPQAQGAVEEHRVLWGLSHACHALVSGEPSRAEALLHRAWARARDAGFTLHLIDGLRLGLLSAAAAGAWAELAARAAELQALADSVDGPRLAEEAAFFAACNGGPPPPEALEAWAADEGASRVRQRWACWWLGEPAPLDGLEAAVWGRCVAEHGWRRAVRLGGDGGSGLGLDASGQRIWASGRVVTDLSRHGVLLALLEALFAHGGAASKEALVLAVWGVASYHPLQHDNRLRVAVRKLRARLGEGLEGAIETLEDGYALRGTWRRLP